MSTLALRRAVVDETRTSVRFVAVKREQPIAGLAMIDSLPTREAKRFHHERAAESFASLPRVDRDVGEKGLELVIAEELRKPDDTPVMDGDYIVRSFHSRPPNTRRFRHRCPAVWGGAACDREQRSVTSSSRARTVGSSRSSVRLWDSASGRRATESRDREPLRASRC